jgi:cytochrome c oxidase cbb3-type subunit 3
MKIHGRHFLIVALLVVSVGCKREQREFRTQPARASLNAGIQLTGLVPNSPSNQIGVSAPLSFESDYQENAYQLSQGQTLYANFNCNTCHAHGGGDIGPPLNDSKWIYGFEPQQVFASIVDGRPKGMPAFGSRLNENQVWELVAYARSLSGLAPKTIAPGRSDEMQTAEPPNSIENASPRNAFTP